MSGIRGLSIKNWMGIEELSITVPPGGMVIEGGNGRGKTSILKAIQAALGGLGLDKSAVRKGATAAEILVDLDAVKVRQRISAEGNASLKVTDQVTGAVYPSPRAFLVDLLGASPLDPLRLFLASPGEQRAMILAAIPASVTFAQLKGWAPGLTRGLLAETLKVFPNQIPESDDEPLPGHGMDVVGKLRAVLYARRRDANKATEEALREIGAAEKVTAARRERYGAACLAAGLPADETAPTLDRAHQLLVSAEATQRALDRARAEAGAAAKRAEKSRGRVAELRAEAAAKKSSATAEPTAEQVEEADLAIEGCEEQVKEQSDHVARLRETLERAIEELGRRNDALQGARNRRRSIDGAKNAAETERQAIAEIEQQAADLESAIGSLPVAPSEEEIARANLATEAARATVARAKLYDAITEALVVEQEKRAAHAKVKGVSDALDVAVKALSDDAPAALLAVAEGIPGLGLEDDDVTLDGISLSRLSGRERMEFAVKVARRLNPKGKFLIVDGIEAIDPENLAAFVHLATADGYQLLATRVAAGPPIARPIAAPGEAGGEEPPA